MKITQFDKKNIPTLREEINAALKAVADKHGINISAGNASFSNNLVTLKIELATTSEDGQASTKESENFKLYAKMLGMTPEHLGQEFVLGGKTYVLIGYNTKASKKPFVVKCKADNKEYKAEVDVVKKAFGITPFEK